MKKSFTLITVFMAVVAIALTVGCTKDDPQVTGPGGGNAVTSIELRIEPLTISAVVGTRVERAITAIARNNEGVGVSGIKISFAIRDPETYKGTISTAGVDTTNLNGEVAATYSVIVSQSTQVIIEARVGQVTETKTLNIQLRDIIGNLSVLVGRNVLTVPPNQTRETTVTATLVDTTGLAVPGAEVTFSTRPATLGFVEDAVGVTDNTGHVTRRFTSIVNQYGLCEIIATVGNAQASKVVEIRTVAGPADIVLAPDSSFSANMIVAEGSNANGTFLAVVTDEDGVGVEGTYVLFRLEGEPAEYPIFGSLSAPDTTDQDGQIRVRFNSRGKFGTEWLFAEVIPQGEGEAGAPGNPDNSKDKLATSNLQLRSGGNVIASMDQGELSTSILLTVSPLGDRLDDLTISARPNYMNLTPDSVGVSNLRATVRDRFGNGISNLQIDFDTPYGTISHVTQTDTSGVATAILAFEPQVDWPAEVDDDQLIVSVTASIPGTNWTKSADITIVRSREDSGTLTLTTDRRFIYADGGLTFATLTAVLKNEDGEVLTGRDVNFNSNYGTAFSPAQTDSLGRAISVFTGDSQSPDSATVTARYNPMGLSASVRIMIREQNPVNSINLVVAAQQMIAGSFDSTSVRATASLLNLDPAPNGTQIHFEAIYGSFTNEIISVTGGFGAAQSYYVAGTQVAIDTLRAYWLNPTSDERIYSNEVLIPLIAGPPSRVRVWADPTILYISDPSAVSTITATVLDTANNPVRSGTFVSFTATFGTITPSSTTDENGLALASLRPGAEARVSQVRATVQGPGGAISDEATVTFISGAPNTIVLTSDTTEIAAAETGGLSTTVLRATVKDQSGNPVDVPTTVVFQLINQPAPPEGCKINDSYPLDSARTASGLAIVSLNAGRQIGGVLVRAYTWRDTARADTVSVILSTVAVVAGPPFQLDIDVNDDGTDAGGGAWAVEVSARVWDMNRNPVANRIPVVFTINPEYANIDPAYTGNIGRGGVAVQGLAYSDMVYNSVNTYDNIEITAQVETPEGIITGSREHILPLQEGELELNVDPGNWMFEEGNEEARIRCWGVLKDGHRILINNAPILFTSNRARFSWYNFRRNRYEEFWPEPARKHTGVQDQENNEPRGQATVFLIAEELDIFLDPFTLEVTVQINASVEEYDDVAADPGFIFFTRHG